MEEESKSKEEAVRITIEAKNVHFKLEKMQAEDAGATKIKAEEKAAHQRKQAKIAEGCIEVIEKWVQKLECKNMAAFEERIYGFLFSTWLQFPKMDFSFLGEMYVN